MVDSLLGGLFGGPDGDRVRAKAQDFSSRYDKGAPEEGYSNDEVLDQFRSSFGQLNPDQQREATEQALQRMSPEQRKEYRRAMRQQQRGATQHFSQDDHDDPRIAAQETQSFMKDASENQSGGLGGMLGNLFGGGGASQQQAHAVPVQEQGSMLDNPAVKAAMAGMAAFAVKKIMDQRQ